MFKQIVSLVCVVLLVVSVCTVMLATPAAAALGPACDAFYNSNSVTGSGTILREAIACAGEDATFFW